MPTPRQLAGWRRGIPEFAEAYEQARIARAAARSDKIDDALNNLRKGKITAADCRVIVETELKLAAKQNAARYGDAAKAPEVSVAVGIQQQAEPLPATRDLAIAVCAPTEPQQQACRGACASSASARSAAARWLTSDSVVVFVAICAPRV